MTATVTRRTGLRRAASTAPGVEYSTLSPEWLAHMLAGAYELGAPVRTELLHRGVNDSYTVAGPAGRFVARVYSSMRAAEEVVYEVALLRHLSAKRLAVPVPVVTREADDVLVVRAPEGDRRLVLFAFLEGTPLRWDADGHPELAGRLAALIHDGGADFATPHVRPCLDVDYLVERPLAAIGTLLGRDAEEWRSLASAGRSIGRQVGEAASRGLDWGMCHGDLSVGNMLVCDDGRPGALDFDFCGSGWRAFDMIAAWRTAHGERRPEVWEAFLRGYAAVRPLARADLDAVPLFAAAGHLWSLGLRVARARTTGTARLGWHVDRAIRHLRRYEGGER